MIDKMSALTSFAHPFRLVPGQYALRVEQPAAASQPQDGLDLPFALVFSPTPDSVTVVNAGGHGPALLRSVGEAVMVTVGAPGGVVIVNVFGTATAATGGLRFSLQPLSAPATQPDVVDAVSPAVVDEPSAAQVDTTAPSLGVEGRGHIERTGDREFPAGEWVGRRGTKFRLEAVALRLAPAIPGVAVEYGVKVKGTDKYIWSKDGGFVGSKGRALPILEFAARLSGPEAAKYDLTYQGHFAAGGDTAVCGAGTVCRSSADDDHLVAVRVAIGNRKEEADWFGSADGLFTTVT